MSCIGEQVRCPSTARTGSRWVVPTGATACYLLFTLAVHLRLTDGLDIAVRRAARPHDVWGPVQARAGRLVRDLPPSHLALGLLLLVAVLSVTRRSVRPFAVAALVGVPAVIVTLATKWSMAHAEAAAGPVGHGSFPSGHAVSAIVATGTALLLVRPGARWGWALPAATGVLMGSALILASVHTATDVIGAGVLAVTVLTSAGAARLGQWARYGRQDPARRRPPRTGPQGGRVELEGEGIR